MPAITPAVVDQGPAATTIAFAATAVWVAIHLAAALHLATTLKLATNRVSAIAVAALIDAGSSHSAVTGT